MLMKSSGPRANFAKPCWMKPYPTISPSGIAYHDAGTGSGEVDRRKRFIEQHSLSNPDLDCHTSQSPEPDDDPSLLDRTMDQSDWQSPLSRVHHEERSMRCSSDQQLIERRCTW